MGRLRLYATLARVSLLDAIQYRVESAIWFLFDVLPSIMMIFVWRAAFDDRAVVAGYSLGEMLAYTIGVILLRSVITVNVEWTLDWQIRMGTLSIHLTRPFSLWGYFLVESSAFKVIRLAMTVPVLLACGMWLGPEASAVAVSAGQVAALFVSVLLAYLVCFFLKLCIGTVGFWTSDIQGMVTLYYAVAGILGGLLVPIALLPDWLQSVARLLPTQAIYGIPLGILLRKGEGTDIATGLASQIVWLLVLWLIARIAWRAGLRQYESVGG